MARGTKRGKEGDELASYCRAIRRYPPLKREEEHLLAVRARRGDSAAVHELVRHNLGLVVGVAFKQRRGTLRLDDLVQEGNLGLMRAVEKFDPCAGTRFSTYAVWWIRAYVGRHLSEARSAVRPRSGTVAMQDVSLDAAVGDADVTLLELLEDDGAGPEASCLAADSDRSVAAALAKVRKRLGGVGWDIVRDRLQQDVPATLAEIGQRWSVSRERARQIEVQTKQFLAGYLEPLDREAA
jgi:RNA polymerase sigma factor (sigma-70 family)